MNYGEVNSYRVAVESTGSFICVGVTRINAFSRVQQSIKSNHACPLAGTDGLLVATIFDRELCLVDDLAVATLLLHH